MQKNNKQERKVLYWITWWIQVVFATKLANAFSAKKDRPSSALGFPPHSRHKFMKYWNSNPIRRPRAYPNAAKGEDEEQEDAIVWEDIQVGFEDESLIA